ncbi:uncharacterized protein V1518DRAFT_250078 [Limtongia smithiae]|uniref:uncharacterized protein n=1 Tax=Limtongia smithiae TaxID=1125753 RepID=UPI0034CE302B
MCMPSPLAKAASRQQHRAPVASTRKSTSDRNRDRFSSSEELAHIKQRQEELADDYKCCAQRLLRISQDRCDAQIALLKESSWPPSSSAAAQLLDNLLDPYKQSRALRVRQATRMRQLERDKIAAVTRAGRELIWVAHLARKLDVQQDMIKHAGSRIEQLYREYRYEAAMPEAEVNIGAVDVKSGPIVATLLPDGGFDDPGGLGVIDDDEDDVYTAQKHAFDDAVGQMIGAMAEDNTIDALCAAASFIEGASDDYARPFAQLPPRGGRITKPRRKMHSATAKAALDSAGAASGMSPSGEDHNLTPVQTPPAPTTVSAPPTPVVQAIPATQFYGAAAHAHLDAITISPNPLPTAPPTSSPSSEQSGQFKPAYSPSQSQQPQQQKSILTLPVLPAPQQPATPATTTIQYITAPTYYQQPQPQPPPLTPDPQHPQLQTYQPAYYTAPQIPIHTRPALPLPSQTNEAACTAPAPAPAPVPSPSQQQYKVPYVPPQPPVQQAEAYRYQQPQPAPAGQYYATYAPSSQYAIAGYAPPLPPQPMQVQVPVQPAQQQIAPQPIHQQQHSPATQYTVYYEQHVAAPPPQQPAPPYQATTAVVYHDTGHARTGEYPTFARSEYGQQQQQQQQQWWSQYGTQQQQPQYQPSAPEGYAQPQVYQAQAQPTQPTQQEYYAQYPSAVIAPPAIRAQQQMLPQGYYTTTSTITTEPAPTSVPPSQQQQYAAPVEYTGYHQPQTYYTPAPQPSGQQQHQHHHRPY